MTYPDSTQVVGTASRAKDQGKSVGRSSMVYDAFRKLVAEYGMVSEGLGGVKYVQQDWQGSVRTVTNNNGFVVARTDHQAFGGEVGYGTGQRSVEQGYNLLGKSTEQRRLPAINS